MSEEKVNERGDRISVEIIGDRETAAKIIRETLEEARKRIGIGKASKEIIPPKDEMN